MLTTSFLTSKRVFIQFCILVLVPHIIAISKQDYQPVNTAILLVPGIGGSMIHANLSGEIYRLWTVAIYQDYYANYLTNQSRADVFVDEKEHGLWAISNLNPDLYYPFATRSWYFKPIIDRLVADGYVPGESLFGLPYDWRKSISDASTRTKLHKKLLNISQKYQKIAIISHSMGGLIVENYLKNNDIPNVELTHIAISAPMKGAAGYLLQAFTSGYNLGNSMLGLGVAKQIALESYSTYELLPQPSLYQPFIYTNEYENYLNYLSGVKGFDMSRVTNRTCYNVTVPTYFITTSSTKTYFDLNVEGKPQNYVLGDGTVPIDSAFHAACYGQPSDHQIDIEVETDHVGVLHQLVTYRYIQKFTRRLCDIRGEYVCENTGVETVTPILARASVYRTESDSAQVNSKITTNNTLVISQNNIYFDNKSIYTLLSGRVYEIAEDCLSVFNPATKTACGRIIGNKCNITDNLPANSTCVYGNIYALGVGESKKLTKPDNVLQWANYVITAVVIVVAISSVIIIIVIITKINSKDKPNIVYY